MKITYFSKTSELGPSSRYRIYQYLPYLEAKGMSVTIRPLFGSFYFRLLLWPSSPLRWIVLSLYVAMRFAKRALDVAGSGGSDLIVVEGQLFPYAPPLFERGLAHFHKIAIEFDDAIYLTKGHGRKMPVLLRLSAATIVGNQTLGAYAASYSSNVHVVPTVVDTDRFRPPTQRGERTKDGVHRSITIAWIGLAYNASYLEWLAPVFRRLQKEFLLKVMVISSRPPVLEGVSVSFKPWNYATEVEDLQACDIGVMPLPDSEWALGKCGLKLLQYMALGLPAVASPIGVNREIIEDGVNGLLATTEEDWHRQLARLCRDSTLREQIGHAGRATVEARYSLKQWGPKLAERYRAISNGTDQNLFRASVVQSEVPERSGA
ncbi:MAG TPA: glycosyltransferase family 4 protein [Nitrospira sp.]|nr:glycosyltransferase family 4 protein [Nitrospira sp.]